MFKKYIQSFVFSIIASSSAFIMTVPQDIIIKNATDSALTYTINLNTKMTRINTAYEWIKAGEKQNIRSKYLVPKDSIVSINIAINLKAPADMKPFSESDSQKVHFGTSKTALITIYKNEDGALYHTISPIKAKACRRQGNRMKKLFHDETFD